MTLIDPDDLVRASDIATLLGVTGPSVSNWQKRNVGFPDPVIPGRWSRTEVMAWHERRIAGRQARNQYAVLNERVASLEARIAELERRHEKHVHDEDEYHSSLIGE